MNEINLSDLLDAPKFIVYAFNNVNKDKKDIKTVLSYLFMSHISLIRNYKIRSNNDMQVLLYEEMQEASNDIAMLRSVAKKATISRSANVTMYTVLNNMEMFEKTSSDEVK